MTRFFILLAVVAACLSSQSFASYQSPFAHYSDKPHDLFFSSSTDLAHTFGTNIRVVNMSSEDEEKIRLAEEKIKLIIASEEFKKSVLNHRYNGLKKFANNEGLTNSQIYRRILEGAERLNPLSNNVMDMDVQLYYEKSTIVGYTMSGSKSININKKYFNKFTIGRLCGNMMHEWLHKLGFKHDVKKTVKRGYSVPYAVGRIISLLGKKEGF